MRLPLLPLAIVLLLAGPAGAQDILQPLGRFLEDVLPQPAPPRVAPATPAPSPGAGEAPPQASEPPPLPRPRPPGLEAAEEEREQETVEQEMEEQEGIAGSPAEPPGDMAPRPQAGRIYQTACPALLSGRVVGEMAPPIADGLCGARSPLLLTAVRVNGREVSFSAPVTTNCVMAGALADWLGEVDAYASAALDSPIAQLQTGTSMMCRPRNGGDEAVLSEHGFANALDVVGMTLEDGRAIGVEADWLPASGPAARLLRQAHGAACGRFTTVLGPDANAAHHDHFHLDLGCHGQSCTAQICE